MQDLNTTNVRLILSNLQDHLNCKTFRGLAIYLGVKENTLYSWINRGTIGDTATIIDKCRDISLAYLKSGEGQMLVGNIDAKIPKPTISMEATATNGSTAVVGDGSAGRDVTNITGETTSFQLTDLELKVIKLNREYGNKNLLKGFLSKLKELKKIADNMF